MEESIDKKSFVTGIIANIFVNGIFFFLSWDKNLIYTGIFSISLFIILLIIVNKYHKFKIIIPAFIVLLLLLGSSYYIEINHINFKEKTIYDDIVHLGDKEISWFDITKPNEKKYLIVDFIIEEIPTKTFIEITAKDVDPDFRSGPVAIFINSQFVSYLNNAKPFKDIPLDEEHSFGYVTGKIELPKGYLVQSKNEMLIALIPTSRGYDDILISEVKLLWK